MPVKTRAPAQRVMNFPARKTAAPRGGPVCEILSVTYAAPEPVDRVESLRLLGPITQSMDVKINPRGAVEERVEERVRKGSRTRFPSARPFAISATGSLTERTSLSL
jgi:hypothetical protein